MRKGADTSYTPGRLVFYPLTTNTILAILRSMLPAVPPIVQKDNGQPAPPSGPPVVLVQFIQFPDGHIEVQSPIKEGMRVVNLVINQLPAIWKAALEQAAEDHPIVLPGASIINRVRGARK